MLYGRKNCEQTFLTNIIELTLFYTKKLNQIYYL